MASAHLARLRPLCSIAHVLDKSALSPVGAAVIALLSFYKARNVYGPTVQFADHVKAQKYLAYLLAFVGVKTLNRVLTRLVRNHGWRADPPKWSRFKGDGDVVLITGGSTGIGKEIVELLAKKTNKIAVLDMAEPTYKARELADSCRPLSLWRKANAGRGM